MIKAGQPLPTNMDLIILPGSKSTIADMQFLINQGWDIDIRSHLRQGGHLLGICGGYQMLGTLIRDPKGIEGAARDIKGLGLLDFETEMSGNKKLLQEQGTHLASAADISGYHMHLGTCTGRALETPFLQLASGADGCRTPDGKIAGTYLHGLFASDSFRKVFLENLKPQNRALRQFETDIEQTLDHLADHLEQHFAIDRLLEIAKC